MQEGVSNYLYSKGSTSFIWGNQRSLLWILQFGCQFCLMNSFNVHPLSSFLSAEYWLGCWRGNEDIETWILLVCSPYGSCCSGHGHLQSCSECDERFSRDFFDLIISCMVWLVIAQLQVSNLQNPNHSPSPILRQLYLSPHHSNPYITKGKEVGLDSILPRNLLMSYDL